MGDIPTGIDGADLVELEIISKERLPNASADLNKVAGLIHPWASGIFNRTGPIGNYPNGPSAEWCGVAQLLDDAITTTATNLDQTATAIGTFLKDILRVDDDAQARMDQHRREMGEADGPR